MVSSDSQMDDMDVDLDKEFLQDLKELKVLVADKDLLDLHKSLVCAALRGKLGVFSEMETNFKVCDPVQALSPKVSGAFCVLSLLGNSAHAWKLTSRWHCCSLCL